MEDTTITVYRPSGPVEFIIVRQSGYNRWPPRLPEQPIIYGVFNEPYAQQIATQWNGSAGGVGFVDRFEVRQSFMDRFQLHHVGGANHTEWWITAEDLGELNENIVGLIELIGKYRS